jgi:hypothetical protein
LLFAITPIANSANELETTIIPRIISIISSNHTISGI